MSMMYWNCFSSINYVNERMNILILKILFFALYLSFYKIAEKPNNPDSRPLTSAAVQLGPVAEFIDPWQADKVNSGIGLLYWPASHVAWRADTTTLYAGVDFIAPVRDLWIRLLFFPVLENEQQQHLQLHTIVLQHGGRVKRISAKSLQKIEVRLKLLSDFLQHTFRGFSVCTHRGVF
jgi:hypothetical protein